MNFSVYRNNFGEQSVPSVAIYSAQTQRAMQNFGLSGQTLFSRSDLLKTLVMGVKALIITSQKIGRIPDIISRPIKLVCGEITPGKWHVNYRLIYCKVVQELRQI